MSIELLLVAVALISSLLGGILLGRRRRTPTPPPERPTPPPPPTATALEWQLVHEIDAADIIDQVAAETDVPAHEIDELVQLADDTRRRY